MEELLEKYPQCEGGLEHCKQGLCDNPLICAARAVNENLKDVQEALKYWSIDTSDHNQFTALHWAAYNDHYDILKYLLNNCNEEILDKKNKHGSCVKACIQENGKCEVLFTEKKNSNNNTKK